MDGTAPSDEPPRRVCLGVIVGVHGVRGVVRIKPFTETATDVGAYGPLNDEAGARRFTLTVHGLHKGTVLAGIAGIEDRDAAAALKGTRLYVDRAALPEVAADDTFYHADLIGLPVEDTEGQALGRVVAVQDFGAGDLLEVSTPDGGERLLPFTREAVPVVDLAAGKLVADPPPETGDDG
jgi:16S rRNA processing protein RimM